MKAVLEFNLPEEASEHRLAIDGANWALAVWNFDEWLRWKLKYGHEYATADAALEASRAELHEILDNPKLRLEDVG